MDSHILFELLHDSQAAQQASESSGLFPWLTSALGLGSMPLHRAIATYIDPSHPFAPSLSSGGGGGYRGDTGMGSAGSDSRLSDVLDSGSPSEQITLADIIGSSGGSSETITLADVVGN